MPLSSAEKKSDQARPVVQLTQEWGDWSSVSLYLDRCRVDTPLHLIEAIWAHVKNLRRTVGKVLDFGAGDGRFSRGGVYGEYIGYEIDDSLCQNSILPDNAKLLNQCAFSDEISDADLCIGNPPYVRNQDLPTGWRQYVSEILQRRSGVAVSGLANAWQYFFLHALTSLKDDGLCVLVIPYEWVSRPSAKALRDYIHEHGWNVKVYRLVDSSFDNVLTTSSITIVDKAKSDGKWEYYEETSAGRSIPIKSPSGSKAEVLDYLCKRDIPRNTPLAKRGLSPGTQKVLTLTEGERVRNGLVIDLDVVPCVTSLRNLSADIKELSDEIFRLYYRDQGRKCWLIRTDKEVSPALRLYLDAVPESNYQTATCLGREEWWKFTMPSVPSMLIAQSFKGKFPKRVYNQVKARAVGSVCGIYNVNKGQAQRIAHGLGISDLRNQVVAHANGFYKIEINQLNFLLQREFGALEAYE